jgi:NitT/TauT family transport system substrate-binding protein
MDHPRRRGVRWLAGASFVTAALAGCAPDVPQDGRFRVGYFPNLTHATALVGLANGAFQRALGDELLIQPFVLNAGPAAIEALFAGKLDLAYIGPNPAINGYVKSQGQALRVVAGSASGGAALVVRDATGIVSSMELLGKRIATPQLGNTQDVALRHYLRRQGLAATAQGGAVDVVPMQNADILTAFLRGQVDAAWAPEPWATRLIHEAGGRVLVDERTLWPGGLFPTALVIVNTRTLRERPSAVQAWLTAHIDVTDWITAHPGEARQAVNAALARLTGKALPDAVLAEAWSRLTWTADPLAAALQQSAQHAFELGFLGKRQPDLAGLVDVTLLNQALAAAGRTLLNGE